MALSKDVGVYVVCSVKKGAAPYLNAKLNAKLTRLPIENIVIEGPDTIPIGGEAEFTATAYDSKERPVPNVEFEWSFVQEKEGVSFNPLVYTPITPFLWVKVD